MGFKSTNGRIHWEYGNPKWKTHKQFEALGGAYDAHVWVSYEDLDDTVCKIQGITPDGGKNCRVYHPLKWQGRDYTKIIEEMGAQALRLGRITPGELLGWSQ